MNRYGILLKPSMNKVFFQASKGLSINELKILDEMVLKKDLHDFREEKLGGVDYITFTSEALTADDLKFLSRLSSLYALFRIQASGAGETLQLIPLEIDSETYFDEDVISIQKYTGKTNEEFTKLLFNIALFCSDYANLLHQRLSVLDPVAGRGTTLFQGLIYGYHVTGIEADQKSVQAMMTFLKRYMMEKRYKHQFTQGKFRRDGRIAGKHFEFISAPTKEAYKAKDTVSVKVVQDDNQFADTHFKKEQFHVIIGDLPYGVQHGSPSNKGSLTRNPKQMVKKSLPAWIKVLKRGGVVALSWNVRILPREQLEELIIQAGLRVLHSTALDDLEHVVDASITRDLLIAKKER